MMRDYKIGIIGLGYVGLPLAVAFAKKFKVIGFDIDDSRVNQLKIGIDDTLEVENDNLSKVISDYKNNKHKNGFYPSSNSDYLSDCNIFIVTVPTPTDIQKDPF